MGEKTRRKYFGGGIALGPFYNGPDSPRVGYCQFLAGNDFSKLAEEGVA